MTYIIYTMTPVDIFIGLVNSHLIDVDGLVFLWIHPLHRILMTLAYSNWCLNGSWYINPIKLKELSSLIDGGDVSIKDEILGPISPYIIDLIANTLQYLSHVFFFFFFYKWVSGRVKKNFDVHEKIILVFPFVKTSM